MFSHSRKPKRRAGSSPGRVLCESEREDVVRPRVRQKSDDGSSHEVELASYQAAKNPQQLQSQIIQAIVSGVSTRGIQEVKPASPGVGRSNVSRLWQEAGSKFVEQLRSRDLKSSTWCALMLDGIRRSSEQTAVVGKKFMEPVSVCSTLRAFLRLTRIRACLDEAGQRLTRRYDLRADANVIKPHASATLGTPPDDSGFVRSLSQKRCKLCLRFCETYRIFT